MNERHRRDDLRIDLSDAEAVRAWTHKLGVSPEELAAIVENVGNHSDNVFEHLLLRR